MSDFGRPWLLADAVASFSRAEVDALLLRLRGVVQAGLYQGDATWRSMAPTARETAALLARVDEVELQLLEARGVPSAITGDSGCVHTEHESAGPERDDGGG